MAACSGCTHDLVGWKRGELSPFMRLVASSAPPPLLGPSAAAQTYALYSPCGARLEAAGTFCSICFQALEGEGLVCSAGETLCAVCACSTFESVEQFRNTGAALWRPRVVLQMSELEDLDVQDEQGRELSLLMSLRRGDELWCCGCIESVHVGGACGEYMGYCTRRRLALLRMGSGVACVSLKLLRRPDDALTLQHAEMLHTLSDVGSIPTLQNAITAVRAAHTMCGTPQLSAANEMLASLKEKAAMRDSEEAPGQRAVRWRRDVSGECYPTIHGLRCASTRGVSWAPDGNGSGARTGRQPAPRVPGSATEQNPPINEPLVPPAEIPEDESTDAAACRTQ